MNDENLEQKEETNPQEVEIIEENVDNQIDEVLAEDDSQKELTLADLHNEILSLKEKLSEKTATDERNSQLIDKLYAQLDEYKNDIIGKLTKPILSEIVSLYDYILKRKLAINSDPQKALKEFEYLPEEIETILTNLSMDSFEPIVDEDKFALKQHKVIKTQSTNDKEKDKVIAQVFCKGFIYEDKIFRQAMVSVYKYSEPIIETKEEAEANDNKNLEDENLTTEQ